MIFNKLKLLCLVLFLMTSCQKKEVLNYSQDKLISVTMDLYFASESLNRITDERADSLRILYNEQIESIHNIEMPLYETDISILKQDLKGYLKFHEIIRDTLLVMNKKIRGPDKKEPKKKPKATKKIKNPKKGN